jgi:hypothetical protein
MVNITDFEKLFGNQISKAPLEFYAIQLLLGKIADGKMIWHLIFCLSIQIIDKIEKNKIGIKK